MLDAGLLGLEVVDRVVGGDWKAFHRVTDAAQKLLGDSDEVDDLVRFGLIEGMHNAASHEDAPTLSHDLRAALPAGCDQLWDEVHLKFTNVATWMADTNQTMQRQSPDDVGDGLTRLFRINYWRSPDGGLIGLADVVDHDEDQLQRERFGFS